MPSTIIFKTKELSQELLSSTHQSAMAFEKQAGRKPGLAVILVGDDPASKLYVKKKSETCLANGIQSFDHFLSPAEGRTKLLHLIASLNADDSVDGILLQSPVPKDWNEKELLALIDPAKDVDGFHPMNAGLLSIDTQKCLQEGLPPCTPAGVVEILKRAGISVSGKNAVVLGRSNIVGKPMVQMLLGLDATVTICHSKTKDLAKHTKRADILVAAIGKAQFVNASHIQQGAAVIDVGINRITRDGKSIVVGDVDQKSVQDIAAFLTPVPFGAGPMTITMLLRNVVRSAYLRQKLKSPI